MLAKDEFFDKVDHLSEVAALEDTELGEELYAIAKMYDYVLSVDDEEFKAAYAKLVNEKYDWVSKNFKIVETTEVREVKVKELVMLGVDDDDID